ncbi:apolipoprotein D [Aplysia californica]|uniref:Apolipoprotein D n=1 Tax=Aplysia californica TaxID=6500 RepID=A0ABM0JA19_APLCA|nr:apolipoprotein D [Aplysia californica]
MTSLLLLQKCEMAFQGTALSLLLMIASTSAQMAVLRYGTECPDPPVQQNFDIIRYMGKWFEYERFPNFFQVGTRCVMANYTLQENAKVKVVNAAIEKYSVDSSACPWYRDRIAVGSAEAADPAEPAKLGVRFNENAPAGKYWVIETDYDNYSVVYSCSPMSSMMQVFVETGWVLTRRKAEAPANLDEIHERLSQVGIDPSNFQLSDHESCPDWPTDD